MASASEAARLKVLCYGDSLTAGLANGSDGHVFNPYAVKLGETLAELGVTAEVVSDGASGFTAEELLGNADQARLDLSKFPRYPGPGKGLSHWLDSDKFDLVILLAGTNDLGNPPVDPRAVVSHIWSLHGLVHQRGIKTIAISVPDAKYHGRIKAAKKERDGIDAELRKLCDAQTNLATFFECPIKWAPDSDLWDKDGLHFSCKGSDKLGTLLATPVLQILSEAQPPPGSAT
jgi:lysophospholipase L1-like esterase